MRLAILLASLIALCGCQTIELAKAAPAVPVVVIHGSPAQAADICAGLGDFETVCYQLDLHQAGKLHRNLDEAGN